MSGSTRTDVVADWILDELEDLYGTRDRCEMWDVYGDGACDEDCAEPDPDCAVVDDEDTGADAADLDGESGEDKEGGCACSTPGRPGLGWAWAMCVGLLGWRRRDDRVE